MPIRLYICEIKFPILSLHDIFDCGGLLRATGEDITTGENTRTHTATNKTFSTTSTFSTMKDRPSQPHTCRFVAGAPSAINHVAGLVYIYI